MRMTGLIWGPTGEPVELVHEDGVVVYRGAPRPEIDQIAQDMGGRRIWPAFVDNHCHILPTGLDLMKLQLGACQTREEVLEAVRDWDRRSEPGQWLLAVHYDQTRFVDGRHITAAELDAISAQRPMVLRHVSGHASVANSAALRASGVTSATPDPDGGAFGRDASGALDGLLLETAMDVVSGAMPKLTPEQMAEAILAACASMADYGICLAADMQTGRYHLDHELQAYSVAAAQQDAVRMRLYVEYARVFGPRGIGADRFRELVAAGTDRLRICGVKIFADGAIGSRTAAVREPYAGATSPGELGTLIYAPEKLWEMMQIVHDAGFSLAIHSIGDRSTDLVLDGFERLGDAQRHRLEHAMMLDDAQIERIANLGCHVTMQPEFLMRFAHAYQRQLGPERASRLKRMRSVWEAGIRLSLSSDRPIVSGDPQLGIQTADCRPPGFDEAENLEPAQALEGYTQRAAEGLGDGELVGSLGPGQWYLPRFERSD